MAYNKKDEYRSYLHLVQHLDDMVQDFGYDQTLTLLEIAVEVTLVKANEDKIVHLTFPQKTVTM
jgi:hypothetical protein